jgi:hypothetical protein
MRRIVLAVTACALLGACTASTQSRVMLDALTQDCAAGNRDSCAAVPAQQAQVTAEAQANTNTAVGASVAALGTLGAVIAAARHR